MKPTRIQRRRTPGWRMPPGAVYVGRPTVWGNPYRVVLADDGGCTVIGPDLRVWYPTKLEAQRVAVTAYWAWLGARPDLVARIRVELEGKTLACWCPLSVPCHADVLLHVANQEAQ